ncbi:MAG TPA: glycosyltransferase family 4 protein, partial [Mycobacteriales bacterium]|nr:glycosyltransferase family 4 protein [Mycobacteriales bacterium]
GLPGNVTVHPPVFGERKAAVLGAAAVYAQPSRWEAFGRSLAEAAMAGTALVVSAECDLAGQVTAAGGGLVVDFDCPDRTAAAIDALLAGGSDGRRAAMGQAAATWAARNFAPALVATRTIAAYRGLG